MLLVRAVRSSGGGLGRGDADAAVPFLCEAVAAFELSAALAADTSVPPQRDQAVRSKKRPGGAKEEGRSATTRHAAADRAWRLHTGCSCVAAVLRLLRLLLLWRRLLLRC